MMSQNSVELKCTVPGCNYTMTITPPFLQHQVTQLLDWQRADAHDLGEAEVVNDHDVQVEVLLEKTIVGEAVQSDQQAVVNKDKNTEVMVEVTPETV